MMGTPLKARSICASRPVPTFLLVSSAIRVARSTQDWSFTGQVVNAGTCSSRISPCGLSCISLAAPRAERCTRLKVPDWISAPAVGGVAATRAGDMRDRVGVVDAALCAHRVVVAVVLEMVRLDRAISLTHDHVPGQDYHAVDADHAVARQADGPPAAIRFLRRAHAGGSWSRGRLAAVETSRGAAGWPGESAARRRAGTGRDRRTTAGR